MECEDICLLEEGVVFDAEVNSCQLLCDPALGQVFNEKKLKCKDRCKENKGLVFDFLDQECVSICGESRVWNQDKKKCKCPGANEKYKKKKDKCKCKNGFVRGLDDACVLPAIASLML